MYEADDTPGVAASLGVVILMPIVFIWGTLTGGWKAIDKLLKESYDAGIR